MVREFNSWVKDVKSPKLRIGSKVLVTKKVKSYDGWGDIWMAPMDDTIGEKGTVFNINEVGDIDVSFDIGCYWYPRSALKVI